MQHLEQVGEVAESRIKYGGNARSTFQDHELFRNRSQEIRIRAGPPSKTEAQDRIRAGGRFPKPAEAIHRTAGSDCGNGGALKQGNRDRGLSRPDMQYEFRDDLAAASNCPHHPGGCHWISESCAFRLRHVRPARLRTLPENRVEWPSRSGEHPAVPMHYHGRKR